MKFSTAHIRKNSEKNTKLVILTINIFILAAVVFALRPKYCTNDDNAMISVLCGAYGRPDGHIIYTNYILGLLLSSLYKIRQDFFWYAAFYYLLMLYSFTVITSVVFRRAKNNVIKALLALVLLFGCFECYASPTYTKSAAVLAIAGMAHITEAGCSDTVKPAEMILGVILCFLSFMVREYMFFSEALICVSMLITATGDQIKNQEKGEIKKRVLRYAVCAAALGMLMCGAKLTDDMAYSSEEWKEYKLYNKFRTEMTDFGWTDYSLNRELYSSLGIDREDIELYLKWDLYDTEVLSRQTLQKLSEAKEKPKITISYLIEAVSELTGEWFKNCGFLLFIIVLVISTVTGKHTKSETAAVLYAFGVFFLMFMYLYYRGRYQVERANFGLYYSLLICTVFSVSSHEMSVSKKRIMLILILSSTILTVCYVRGNRRIFEDNRDFRKLKQEYTVEHADDDRLYISDMSTAYLVPAYAVFDIMPTKYMTNNIPLGTWLNESPVQKNVMRKWGVTNPFRALVENENAYLLDGGNFPEIYEYLKKHYGEDIVFETVRQDYLTVYKFSHGEDSQREK